MIQQLIKIIDSSQIDYDTLDFYTYCVADGVKYPMLYSDLEEGTLHYDILFKEEALREKLQTVAPFVIQLNFEDEKQKEESEALIEQCYGKNGAIFFATPLDFTAALEKMREIFYLHDETGEMQGVFRFYEPLVFEGMMHNAQKEAQKSLFNNIYCYWCEEKKSQTVVEYRYTPKGIGYRKIDLNNKETS